MLGSTTPMPSGRCLRHRGRRTSIGRRCPPAQATASMAQSINDCFCRRRSVGRRSASAVRAIREDAKPLRDLHRLPRVEDVELAYDCGDMRFDRGFGAGQLVGNLFVKQTLRHKRKHVSLLRRGGLNADVPHRSSLCDPQKPLGSPVTFARGDRRARGSDARAQRRRRSRRASGPRRRRGHAD